MPTSCGQCDVPAVVGEDEMLLNPGNQKSLPDPSDCNLSTFFFFLADCKKDCIVLVKNVFDRLLHSKSLLDPSDCNLSSFLFVLF